MKSRTGSLEMIKKINRQLVLETIKVHQPISRARIARELSLSKTTVSAICDELLRSRMAVSYTHLDVYKRQQLPLHKGAVFA